MLQLPCWTNSGNSVVSGTLAKMGILRSARPLTGTRATAYTSCDMRSERGVNAVVAFWMYESLKAAKEDSPENSEEEYADSPDS